MSHEVETSPVQKLVESFRSLLDEALIVAIANDHDLQQPSEYQAAHAILQGLSQDVTSEEATGFNPSGLPMSPEGDASNDHLSTSTTTVSQPASQSGITDSSGTDISLPTADYVPVVPRLTSFNDDTDESKAAQLHAMFAELKEYDVQYSLKKANGDFQLALDDLLTVQFLASTGQQKKGVDGFFRPDAPASQKGKRKGKKPVALGTDPAGDGLSSPGYLKTIGHQDKIAYLADMFDLPFEQVSDIYQRKHSSSGATAVEILDQYISLGIETKDEAGKKEAGDLARKYRNVPEKYMSTLVQVTGSPSQFSGELAALLSKHFAKNPWTEKLDLSYRLTPLPQEDIEGSTAGIANKASAPGSRSQNALSASKLAPSGPSDFAQAIQMSNEFGQSRRDALAAAAQMNRKGASNPLYRQAASYYSERAREQGRHAQQATSTAADYLVSQQSTTRSIDLHGVTVRDGTRIARQRVQAWWDGLGEFRSRRAREQSFTVVTGLGRHSAGGVSQLRQAVAAALLQDGWRIQVETGRFVVTGRR